MRMFSFQSRFDRVAGVSTEEWLNFPTWPSQWQENDRNKFRGFG